jgi:hypothetical protein
LSPDIVGVVQLDRADVAAALSVNWYWVTVTALTWWVADIVTAVVVNVPAVVSPVLLPESHL